MLVLVMVCEGKCWGVGDGTLTTTDTFKQTHTRLTTTRGHTHTLSDTNNQTKTETSTHMKRNPHTRHEQQSVVCRCGSALQSMWRDLVWHGEP